MIATARDEKSSEAVTVRSQGDGLIGPRDIGWNPKWWLCRLGLKKVGTRSQSEWQDHGDDCGGDPHSKDA
jgi:hypothetical protein